MRRNVLLSVLVVLLGACALVVTGCGGEEEVLPTAETVVGEGGDTGEEPADTGEEPADTGEEPADTGEEPADTGGDDGDGEAQGDAEAGAAVYEEAGCGGCHVLEAAGSSGNIGPSLDESQPDFELVVDRVTNGQGAMPAFGDRLSEEEIQNVAAYVVESTQ